MRTNPENIVVLFGIAAVAAMVICYLGRPKEGQRFIASE